jgi:group I intron endonuclease
MIIYQITNTVNHKIYIGKTKKTTEERFKRHYYAHTKSDTYLYRAMRKYGFDNFKIEIIENVDSDLDSREKFWIKELSPHYNMTEGGEGGDTSSSPNFITSMEKYHSKKDPSSYASYGMLGKTLSEQARQKLSKKNSYPVMCEGIVYSSIKEAQEVYQGISIRRRIDNPRYPDFYRLREKRLYTQQSS